MDDLTTQLEQKLSFKDEPLEKRVELAQKVFCSTSIPISQKEEIVLLWLVECYRNKDSEMNLAVGCTALLHCLKSQRMKSFTGNIKPSIVREVLKILEYVEDRPENITEDIRKCIVEVMGTPFFQRFFTSDINCITKLSGHFFNSVNNSNSLEEFTSVIDHLVHVHKTSLMKREMRIAFVHDVLVPLCVAIVKLGEANYTFTQTAAVNCVKEILLYESTFIDDYCTMASNKNYEECSKELKSFIKKLKHLPTKQSPQIVETCYSVFLKSVVTKYPEDYIKIFRVFTLLCPPLGVIVNQIISIEMNPVNNWEVNTDSFFVIKHLIDVLDESKIPLTCELEDVSLKNWFASLVIGLSNINNRSFSVNFFEMISRVFDFIPTVIEVCAKQLTKIMVQYKPPELQPSYSRLLQSVIKGCLTLDRLQKFIAYFLDAFVECINTTFHPIQLTDILPLDVSSCFAEAFKVSTNSQIINHFSSLIYHLKKDCVAHIEADSTSASVIVNMEVVVEIMCQLINSSQIACHSVPEVVQLKFKHYLEELQAVLRNLGVELVDTHDDRLLISFFKLCKAFGDKKLLFREYDNLPIEPPQNVDLEPANLTYVHNYLMPENWVRIGQKIQEHHNCTARYPYYELLIQKIESVSQVEEGYEGPGTCTARYLLQVSDSDWLWSKLTNLAPLFQSSELVHLVQRMVQNKGNDQKSWLDLMDDEAFTEDKRLLLATGLGLLHRVSKIIKSDNKSEEEALGDLMLSLVNDAELLEYELSQLIVEDEERAETIRESISEMAALLNERLPLKSEQVDQSPHPSFFEVLHVLPLHHFSVLSQCSVVLCVTALLYDLSPDSTIDMYLFNTLLKIVDGPKKHINSLLGGINPGILLRFIAVRGKEYKGQNKLMKQICLTAFQKKASAKKLLKIVSEPTVDDVWITSLVTESLMKIKKNISGGDNKKPLDRKKCVGHLVELINNVLEKEDPTQSLVFPYSIAFKHALSIEDADIPEHLLLKLSSYVDLAISDYGEGCLLIQTMCRHRARFQSYFPDWLLARTWDCVLQDLQPPPESITHLFFEAASVEELKSLAQLLTSATEESLKESPLERRLELLLALWNHLVTAILPPDKNKVRQERIRLLSTAMLAICGRWQNGTDLFTVQPVMELISALARGTSVDLEGYLLDSCLEVLREVPLSPTTPPSHQFTLLSLQSALDAFFSLYLFRTFLLIDRLPVYLQVYRVYLKALAQIATPSISPNLLRAVDICSDKIGRVVATMAKRRKDFSRLSPYLIADLMHIMQKSNICDNLKYSYTNIVNTLFDLCDDHGISYLKSILPLGQQEFFNNMYENYKKFNRFEGSI